MLCNHNDLQTHTHTHIWRSRRATCWNCTDESGCARKTRESRQDGDFSDGSTLELGPLQKKAPCPCQQRVKMQIINPIWFEGEGGVELGQGAVGVESGRGVWGWREETAGNVTVKSCFELRPTNLAWSTRMCQPHGCRVSGSDRQRRGRTERRRGAGDKERGERRSGSSAKHRK